MHNFNIKTMEDNINKDLSNLIMKISKNLIIERNRYRLTQEQLAYSSDLTVGTISRIERGDIENISLKTLLKLCNALKIDIISLVY